MLLSLVPITAVTANAADGFVEVSTYKELKDEVDKGEAKVKLVANIDTTNENGGAGVTNQTVLKFFGNNNILDLNGHTLKLVSNTGATFIYVNKDLTIKDSGTGGRIDFGYGPGIVTRTTAIHVADASTANLTVESGTLSSTKGGITLIESEGNLTINGGKFYAPYREGSGGTYAIHTIHQYNDNAKTIITSGEIDGVVLIQRDDSAATGTPNYGDIPVQIKGGTFKQAVLFRWTEKGKPSGDPTEFSPAVEIAGGIFEKRVNGLTGIWGEDLSTKLTGGTFKDFPNRFGLGRGGKSDHEYYSKSLGNSIIMRGNEIRTSCDWSEADWFKVYFDSFYLDGSESNPVTVIRNAWGMKSVTLDGNPIDYFKDWNGTVERMDNSTAHTLKFEWYPLAQELKDAGYTYRANFDCYTVGSNTPTTSVPISATATEYSHTILAGAAPSVYPFDLQLNLDKNGSSVGIMSNQHIVKLVVSEAPVVTEISSAPVRLSAALTPGTSAPSATAVGSGYTVGSIKWYTDSGCNTPASAFVAGTKYYGKIVLKPAENYKFAASASALFFCDDPNENYSIVVSSTVAENGSSLTLVVKGTAVSALKWDSVDKTNQTYTIGDSALTLNAKATGGESGKPITYKLIAKKDGTETVKASSTVAASSTDSFSAFLSFTDTGSYECWFEATRGNVTITSDHFTVTVNAPGLSIANQSGDLTVKQNATARLFVKAVGHGVNYQWQVKNGGAWNAISGETAYDYAAPTTNVGEKTYRCKVTDKYGATKYTNEMTVTVTAVADSSLTPAILLAAVNGDAPDPAKLWPDKDVEPNGWLGLKAEYDVTAGDTFHGVATFSTIPTGFNMNGHDIYYDSYNNIQKTPVLGTISYEWEGTTKNPWEASSGDFTSLGTDAHASFTIPSGVNTYYVKLSVMNTVGTETQTSTVYITFHVSAAHTHTYAYAQLNKDQHTKYCTAGDDSITETHTMENGVCKYCGYAPAKTYSVTVTDGSADHSTNVAPGTKVTLTANTAPSGQEFDKWAGNVTVASDNTFTMPSHDVTVAATYKPIAHTHDTDAQPWVYMDPGTHIKTCTAGDDFKVEAHDFSAWTKVDESTHSRTCSKCKKSGETANYTETANHNWQWVAVTPATPNADGKQHEECADCHAVKAGSETVIPALTSIKVENLTVAKPVRDVAATTAASTDSTYYVESTEWKAADGTALAIGDTFRSRTVYTVNITLKTAGTDVFSEKSTYNDIEGKTAAVNPVLTGDAHADSVILTYTFDSTGGSTGGSGGRGTSRYTV